VVAEEFRILSREEPAIALMNLTNGAMPLIRSKSLNERGGAVLPVPVAKLNERRTPTQQRAEYRATEHASSQVKANVG
jgi:hypothetical protein